MKNMGPIPKRIAELPRDERGYPIPFFAQYVDGKPDLRIADGRKAVRCDHDLLCWVCGQALLTSVCFIGGPKSAQSGTYSDGPMHRDCAEFSLRVCPHLAIPNASRRSNDLPENVVEPVGYVEKKPEILVMRVQVNREWQFHTGYKFFRCHKPARAFRFWKAGVDITGSPESLALKIS